MTKKYHPDLRKPFSGWYLQTAYMYSAAALAQISEFLFNYIIRALKALR